MSGMDTAFSHLDTDCIWTLREQILKKRRDRLIQVQLSVIRKHADGQARHRLADRIEAVGPIFPEGAVTGGGFLLPADGEQETVHIHILALEAADHGLDAGFEHDGIDPFRD